MSDRSLVRKTCDILTALAEGEASVKELVVRVRLPKASLHWMLMDLIDMGYVDRIRKKQAAFGYGSPPYYYTRTTKL